MSGYQADSVINQVMEAVIELMNSTNPFAGVTRGALPTGPGITCEVGPSMARSMYMDKNTFIPLDVTINGKHPNMLILDTCAQETYVCHLVLGCCLCTSPHTRTLDIDADVVCIGIALGQSNGVLALTTTQLQDDRVVVMEEILVPTPLQGVILVKYILKFGLNQTTEC